MNFSTETASTPPSGRRLPGRSHREYRRALRHSGLVRLMKFGFPLIAVLVFAGFFWASIFKATLPDNFHFDRTAIQDGKLVMSDPVLTGENSKGALYRLTARRAIQDLSDVNNVRLEKIHASLPIGDGKFATIEAKSATYDRSADIITFDQPFQVDTQTGMTAKLEGARFDVHAGLLVSKTPVMISSDEGKIVADSMRMGDNGHTIEFNDKVRMTLTPKALKATKEDEANR
ncbi:MAG TPA: LPS export ABC transporter periplasmic protein LptC [Pararhizobium sp.]|nr:LPS export ABC transporter periplasmic protein LptC [Pararhizobium sp.]